jgi:hypothetical protein
MKHHAGNRFKSLIPKTKIFVVAGFKVELYGLKE